MTTIQTRNIKNKNKNKAQLNYYKIYYFKFKKNFFLNVLA